MTAILQCLQNIDSVVNGQVVVPGGGHEKVPTPSGLFSWV